MYLALAVAPATWYNKYYEWIYSKVDSAGTEPYADIFTTRDKIYSGSEATEFHLARMYAFGKILKHDYPIIVDSFRAEDLSTERENKVLNEFKELDNQIIFTTTLRLKKEKNMLLIVL